jgi:hypothetical protein
MKNFVTIAFVLLATGTSAFAGSGSLNGIKTFNVNGRVHSLECNAHAVPLGTQNQKFICEYENGQADNGANDSIFIGEVINRPRGSVFTMIQFGDVSDYVSRYVGTIDASGNVTGSTLDVAGNQFSFSIN